MLAIIRVVVHSSPVVIVLDYQSAGRGSIPGHGFGVFVFTHFCGFLRALRFPLPVKDDLQEHLCHRTRYRPEQGLTVDSDVKYCDKENFSMNFYFNLESCKLGSQRSPVVSVLDSGLSARCPEFYPGHCCGVSVFTVVFSGHSSFLH